MASWDMGPRRMRLYKRWRYPDVPIPYRLQDRYSNDPRKCVLRFY
jgi:hypothetical protein